MNFTNFKKNPKMLSKRNILFKKNASPELGILKLNYKIRNLSKTHHISICNILFPKRSSPTLHFHGEKLRLRENILMQDRQVVSWGIWGPWFLNELSTGWVSKLRNWAHTKSGFETWFWNPALNKFCKCVVVGEGAALHILFPIDCFVLQNKWRHLISFHLVYLSYAISIDINTLI